MKKYIAYIDESGESIFAEGASKTFFIGATYMDLEKSEENRKKIVEIKNRYNIVEFKSSKVDNFDRRYNICNELSQLNIKIATIYVEKEKLVGDWFIRKGTFYKYIQRLLNHRLWQTLGNVSILIDKYGSLQYQESLKNILIKGYRKNCFLQKYI